MPTIFEHSDSNIFENTIFWVLEFQCIRKTWFFEYANSNENRSNAFWNGSFEHNYGLYRATARQGKGPKGVASTPGANQNRACAVAAVTGSCPETPVPHHDPPLTLAPRTNTSQHCHHSQAVSCWRMSTSKTVGDESPEELQFSQGEAWVLKSRTMSWFQERPVSLCFQLLGDFVFFSKLLFCGSDIVKNRCGLWKIRFVHCTRPATNVWNWIL